MTLRQAFWILDQIVLTIYTLEEEGLEFDIDTVISDEGRLFLYENS